MSQNLSRGRRLAYGVYLYFMQSQMLYYPEMPGRSLDATPKNIGLNYRDITLITADNIKLHGWFIPSMSSRGTVLFFHGNAGNISHRLESIALFHDLGLDVFIIDYRGYGKSGGKPTEQGTYRDAEAAWNYLIETRNVNPENIIIFGCSLGGSIAAWLTSRHTPAALIVESAFTSVPAMAQRFYAWMPVRWISRFQYNTRHYIENLACPVLVAHSRDDEIIPYEEGRILFDTASEPKRFLTLRGGHNDGMPASGTAYREGLSTFIEEYLHRAD